MWSLFKLLICAVNIQEKIRWDWNVSSNLCCVLHYRSFKLVGWYGCLSATATSGHHRRWKLSASCGLTGYVKRANRPRWLKSSGSNNFFVTFSTLWALGVTIIRVISRLNSCYWNKMFVNPCTAELFVTIFHLFEAGIANAISSFKWMNFF